ncbi:MAG: dihydroorotate dehydrogenase electron transfer subunit [Dehalococcoidales bacterium]|nr:dihydroorotate dehydrogenase electron transfer subunit [Dehalococcoidales bacterium]
MKQYPAAIISSREAMPGTYLLWLRSLHVASGAKPGQFVMVRCGEDNELPLRRPLSIHRIDGDGLALLFNTVGKGTRWLSQRQKDEPIDLLGPLGNGFTIYTESRQILLIAGGMGIVPLVYLADIALKHEKRVTLLVGARSAAQLLPEELLPRGVTLVTATEDGTQGYQGYVSELLPDHADSADQIFACGPTAMYREMVQRKRGLGLEGKPIQISLEMRMGCGLGVCYACTVRTRSGLKQVCQDGPVFELDGIIWDEMIPD